MKTLLVALAATTCLTLAQAQTFTASMNGAQDGGGARQGTGFVTLTLSGNTLSLNGTYSGITTTMSAGHIHGPAGIGTNAIVIYDLIALGVLSGTTSGTFNGNVNLIASPNANPNYSSIANQITDLNAGLWYLNIHNSTFPGGEIRGQILLIPEPSSLALLGLGAGALLYRLRRKQ
jgi:hypothetical protein